MYRRSFEIRFRCAKVKVVFYNQASLRHDEINYFCSGVFDKINNGCLICKSKILFCVTAPCLLSIGVKRLFSLKITNICNDYTFQRPIQNHVCRKTNFVLTLHFSSYCNFLFISETTKNNISHVSNIFKEWR